VRAIPGCEQQRPRESRRNQAEKSTWHEVFVGGALCPDHGDDCEWRYMYQSVAA
jgi:hypothetical protein